MTRLKIRHMTPADLPAMDAVSALRGFRETTADWECALQLSPQGCLAAERDGAAIAFAATFAYGYEVGWISSILVADAGDAGIESVMRDHCIEVLRSRGVGAIAFDACDTNSRRHEFAPLYSITKCESQATASSVAPRNVRAASNADIPAIAELDAKVFGANRESLFRLLMATGARAMVTENSGSIDGFGLIRPATSGWILGPVIASDSNVQTQIADALQSTAGPIQCDIVMSPHTANWSRGFSTKGRILRIVRGEFSNRSQSPCSFATGGAFFG